MDAPVTARAAALQALLAGPSHGLAIIAWVSGRTGGRVVLKGGSLYPALWSLERDGLAVIVAGPSAARRGGRQPIHYRITDAGIALAREHAATVQGLFALGAPSP